MPRDRHRPRAARGFAAVSALAALLALPATPASAQAADAPGAWRVQLTPYVWAAGMGGDIRVARGFPTLRVDQSFGEILGDLRFGVFVNGLAIRDRLVLSADLSYVSIAKKGDLLAAPPIAGRGALTQFSTTLMAGYRAVQVPGFDLDLLGGVRVWSIGADAEARIAGTPFLRTSANLSWADPMLAVRARFDLAPRFSAHLLGDLGGFDAGSRFTWQAAALLNYQVNDNLFASIGYRHLAFDYRDGGRRADVALSGPVIGATWRF